MNRTIKLLLFNILLCSAPALQAMGNLRAFGARAFKAAAASAAKFKMHTRTFKTANTDLPRYFGTYTKKALQSAATAGFLYSGYESYKKGAKWHELKSEVAQEVLFLQERVYLWVHGIEANAHKYGDLFIANWEKAFNPAYNTDAEIAKHVKIFCNIYGFLSKEKRDVITFLLLKHTIIETPAPVIASILSFDPKLTSTLGEKIRKILEKEPEKIDTCLSNKCDLFMHGNGDLIQLIGRYYSYYLSPQEREKFLETASRAFDKKEDVREKLQNMSLLAFLKGNYSTSSIPCWYLASEVSPNKGVVMQTEAHFNQNTASVVSLVSGEPVPQQLRDVLVKVYEKEKEEQQKGNYVFYHAQDWKLHYYSDVYKQLWNIAKNDAVQDDFTFTRFNQQKQIRDFRKDSLFLNHALFGNSADGGSCSYDYFINNHSVYAPTFSPQEFCKNLGLTKQCACYEQQFRELEKLHTNASDKGNLLMVSIPQKHIDKVKAWFPIQLGEGLEQNAQKIIDTMKQNPKALSTTDIIEYILPLTTEYALDPKNGPRFYSYNMADKEKFKQYTQARDALFMNLKKDYEESQKAGIWGKTLRSIGLR